MTGTLACGTAVSVRRDGPAPHPLAGGTDAELRSTWIRTLRAAGLSWSRISRITGLHRATLSRYAAVPPVRLHHPGRHDAG